MLRTGPPCSKLLDREEDPALRQLADPDASLFDLTLSLPARDVCCWVASMRDVCC